MIVDDLFMLHINSHSVINYVFEKILHGFRLKIISERTTEI